MKSCLFYLALMEFTWDLDKENKNLVKHGFKFSMAEEIIKSPDMLLLIDDRYDYGEERYLSYAEIEGLKVCLCYVIRDDVHRVISLRRVHDKEWRKVHGDSYL